LQEKVRNFIGPLCRVKIYSEKIIRSAAKIANPDLQSNIYWSKFLALVVIFLIVLLKIKTILIRTEPFEHLSRVNLNQIIFTWFLSIF